MTPTLVLGPLLRYVSETEATVWVETSAQCEVEVLGHRASTFRIAGHHYAVVVVSGLRPGSVNPYEVALDGTRQWPEPGEPASVIRTLTPGRRAKLAFGSCLVTRPDTPPHALGPDESEVGVGVDAFNAFANRVLAQPHAERPDLLLMLGDQVYADEVSPGVAELIAQRQAPREAPADEVADFEEYTQLYREAWTDPPLRRLLATLPTAMIFDDHDLHDDWNTSEAWVHQMRAKPWWEDRIAGAFMSYWIYQHLGNLSPRELAEDELLRRITNTADGTELLREFATRASHDTDGARWSYARTLGSSKLVVIDSRAGRVLAGERRSMLDDAEWEWLEREASGDVDHLLLATSVPWLLMPALHGLEAWNEAVCGGAWGARLARLGERLRQDFDLEHWAAFEESFARLARIIDEVASGARGAAPATIVVLSGDVHHSYLARAWIGGRGRPRPRAGADATSLIYQAVCSPFRHPLRIRERRMIRAAGWRPTALAARILARAARAPAPGVRWELAAPPTFENSVATLTLDERQARLTIERALPDWRNPQLSPVLERRLA